MKTGAKVKVRVVAGAVALAWVMSATAADLVVSPGNTRAVSSSESYETVTLQGAVMRLDSDKLSCRTVSATADSTLRFNGGKLGANGWDYTWFSPASGATLTLESVASKDIYLDVGYQRHNFSEGAGTVATAGSGDIVVNSLKDTNGNRMYLTFNNANVTWGHSGDIRVTGEGGLRLLQGGTLPSGASAGGIKLQGSTELRLESLADSQVNSIEGPVRSVGWSWLKFGSYKDGVFKNAPNVGGVCNVEKHGADTTLTLDNTAFRSLTVAGGNVIASGGATTVGDLSMSAETTLNVSNTAFTATDSSSFGVASMVSVGERGVFDVVSGRDAALFLDSSGSVVKRGAGAWDVYPSRRLSGRIQVSGGSVKLRYTDQVYCTTDQWWRVSITKQRYYTRGVCTAEIALFSGGERVNAGLTATGAAVGSMPNGTAKITSGDFSAGNVANLFDSKGSTIWGDVGVEPPADAPLIYGGHYLTVVMRLPSVHVGKPITAVDVSDNQYYQDWSRSFTVESSPDGVNWTARGSYSWDGGNVTWPNWYGGSSHFAVSNATREVEGTGRGGYGLADGTVVRVDSNATLDMSLARPSQCVISCIEIDAQTGMGTITDGVFADHGTINVVNATLESLKLLEVPLTLVRVTDSANLANWSLKLDGEPLTGHEISLADGVLTIASGVSEDDITHECALRISEIMPKPTDARNLGALEGMDVNGLESGWVELENMSDKWVDLTDYRFIRVNRGKKTDPLGSGNFPHRLVAPHSRTVFYTSERYPNSDTPEESAFAEGTFDAKPAIYPGLNNVLVWGKKVNPKKFPYVRLYFAPGGDADKGTVIDTVVIPSDIPEGCSIIVGEAGEGEGTRRWLCPMPTRGATNPDTVGLVRLGPNVGPLYEKKGQKKTDIVSEFDRVSPPAVPGEDYAVTLPVNGVMNPDGTFKPRTPDQIASIKLVCRKDLMDSTLVTNDVDMSTKTTDENWGDQYAAVIPADYFPAAGHLVQWKLLVTDNEGVEWTSPSFNNPDDGYEWYGTIVAPGDLDSATLPTWHMFAEGNHLSQMDVDADYQDKKLVPNKARVAIYDSSTSNYYDYVRIDLRGNTTAGFAKKSHGLRFAKAHPLAMTDIVTGKSIEGIRKTSLISEYADPSFMRQMVAFWLWRKMGNLVPFDFPVRCNLNGEFYQLAFNSERFTDELIEDVYGLDKYGYGYKNVATLKSNTGTPAGAIEKKTPDDEDESNLSVLEDELRSRITAAQDVSSSPDAVDDNLDNAALTKFVVQKFNLPAWLNYLASARITQEMDDVWANICAYYDNAEMKEGVRGTDTWMPLGYDFNLSFGQWHYTDLENYGVGRFGLSADQDWLKSHPLYGGNRVIAWRNEGMTNGTRGNDGVEAVLQSAKFRRLFLRRLRTLMDQELKSPETPEIDVPFMVKMREMADLMRVDAALDQARWPNDESDDSLEVWSVRPTNMDDGIEDIWNNYVVPRRTHLYVTHSATNTARAIGYASSLNAGIPEAQSPIEELAQKITVDVSRLSEGVVVVSNANDEVVDMSGWTLCFGVNWTLPPGTVCDSNDCVYIVADRRTFIARHEGELTDEVIVGNAEFGDMVTVFLNSADGYCLKGVASGDNTIVFEAKNQKAADSLVAGISPELSTEDVASGLDAKCLKVVAEPVEGESGRFRAVVSVNSDVVAAPLIESDISSGDAPMKVEDDSDGGKTVSINVGNAVRGLWYGYEVSDSPDTGFANDVPSFKRATGSSTTITGSKRNQPSGFFRVKVLPAQPQ